MQIGGRICRIWIRRTERGSLGGMEVGREGGEEGRREEGNEGKEGRREGG